MAAIYHVFSDSGRKDWFAASYAKYDATVHEVHALKPTGKGEPRWGCRYRFRAKICS